MSMQPRPLVSVITLTYKRFDRLFETVRSVFEQDYPFIEYVISDDGSGDFPSGDLEVFLKDCNSSNVNVVVCEAEQNVGTVRHANRVCSKATGDYIMMLSCGDVFFEPTTVSKIVNRFQTTGARVMVTTRLLYEGDYHPICLLPHYADRRIIANRDTPLKQYKALILSQFLDMASGSAMFYSTKTLREYGFFDERFFLWEDGPFLEKYLWDDTLEMAYDIVSTWYEFGGVSTSDRSCMHPRLQEDTFLFNHVDRMKHFDSLTPCEKRKLLYRIERSGASLPKRAMIYLKYFPEVVFYLVFSYQREKRAKLDAPHINKLLKDHANETSISTF